MLVFAYFCGIGYKIVFDHNFGAHLKFYNFENFSASL